MSHTAMKLRRKYPIYFSNIDQKLYRLSFSIPFCNPFSTAVWKIRFWAFKYSLGLRTDALGDCTRKVHWISTAYFPITFLKWNWQSQNKEEILFFRACMEFKKTTHFYPTSLETKLSCLGNNFTPFQWMMGDQMKYLNVASYYQWKICLENEKRGLMENKIRVSVQ